MITSKLTELQQSHSSFHQIISSRLLEHIHHIPERSTVLTAQTIRDSSLEPFAKHIMEAKQDMSSANLNTFPSSHKSSSSTHPLPTQECSFLSDADSVSTAINHLPRTINTIEYSHLADASELEETITAISEMNISSQTLTGNAASSSNLESSQASSQATATEMEHISVPTEQGNSIQVLIIGAII